MTSRAASAVSPTSVTIAGVPATLILDNRTGGSGNTASLWCAIIPSGTTGVVSVTWASTVLRGGVQLVKVVGSVGTPSSVTGSSGSSMSATLTTTSKSGAGVGGGYFSSNNEQRVEVGTAIIPSSSSINVGVTGASGGGVWTGLTLSNSTIVLSSGAGSSIGSFVVFEALT